MFANEQRAPFSLVHYWKRYIFLYLTISPSSFQNKKCGNRSYRTEKRKLQLSPNKTNFTDKHHVQVSGASVFAWFYLTRKNRYRYKTPYKNRAFILESYLVLFGIFIVSHFLRFVNIFGENLSDYLPGCKQAFLCSSMVVNFPDKHCICVHECKNTAYLFRDIPYF